MDPLIGTATNVLKAAGKKEPAIPVRTEEHKQQGGRKKIVGIPVYRKVWEEKGKKYGKA